jgi:hypothetical protein
MSARFGNVFDTLYMMNHRHPAGLQTPPRRLSLVVRAPSGRSAPCVRPARGYKHPLSRVNFLSDGAGSHRVLVGYLFVSMDILSGSAGVLGEWLKQLREFLSIP